MHRSKLALVCVSFLGLACADPGGTTTSTSSSETGDGDTDGECVPPNIVAPTPTPISPACLVDTPCVEDVNCPPGYTCNAALDPPQCSKIYCGAAGSPCSSAGSCLENLECNEGICNPCNVCGDLCSVDFQTDPQHCGCCDNPVPESGACVDGQPGCALGSAACDGACINVTDDPNNCGSCGNVVGSGAECVNGEIVCTSPNATTCGNDCVSLSDDDAHCGGCDRVCPEASDGCQDGSCMAVTTDRISCADACAEIGLVCEGNSHVAYYVGNLEDEFRPVTSCDEVPPENNNCNGVSCQFVNLRCFCGF